MARTELVMMITLLTAAHLVFSHQMEAESIHRLISYTHVWPEMELGWRIVLATTMAFLAAGSGSAGGSVGGGFFVAMFILVLGFDINSSSAMSNCIVMATAGVTTYLNLKKKNPITSNQSLINYDLVFLIHPMLLLGVGIGVVFNVILAEWMLTLLLFILFLVMSIRAYIKSVEAWNKETSKTMEATQELNSVAGSREPEYEPLVWRLPSHSQPEARFLINVHWKEVVAPVTVWIAILALQVSKSATTSCSAAYWVLTLLQIPVAVGAFAYEAMKLIHRGVVRASGGSHWTPCQLALCCMTAVVAGAASAMLGVGGGFLLCPLFLHLGISPQASSATATLAVTISSSISVVEYYLLKRFPLPYTMYFSGVAIAATVVGNLVVKFGGSGRPSILIFVLASAILIIAVLLGANGMIDVMYMVENSEFVGFQTLCS